MALTSTLPLYSHPKVIYTRSLFFEISSLSRKVKLTLFVYMFCYSQVLPKKQRLGLQALASDHGRWLGHDSAWFITRRYYSRSKRLVVTAAYGAEGGARRRAYRQSQAQQPLSSASVKQIATFVAPAGVFIAATFGMDFRFSSFLVVGEFGRM